MNKNILITGGLGFLGSYCIEKYKSEGWNITVIDNLSSNVLQPDDPICDGVNVIIKDILDIDRVEGNFDLLMHLASPVGPAGILKFSGQIGEYIIDDIYWAIRNAQALQCPLIFVSTSEIYGYRDFPEHLKEDDYKILIGNYTVRNEYSTAKLLSEIIIENVAKVEELKYQIIRPFNISGARQLKNGGFVLPTFVQQALSGTPLTVFYTGKQVRSFTHAKDIVNGMYLTSVTTDQSKWNSIWNVGAPENETSINELAELVVQFTDSKSEIVHVDPKTIHGNLYEEAWDKIPNPDKVRNAFGWQPTFTKEEIIRDVIQFEQSKVLSNA